MSRPHGFLFTGRHWLEGGVVLLELIGSVAEVNAKTAELKILGWRYLGEVAGHPPGLKEVRLEMR